MSLFEWAIIAFIIMSILWHVWKGGAANPEGTRTLGHKVSGLATKVGNLSTRVGHVEAELEDLKIEAATTKDIQRLEEKIDGQAKLAERTHRSVDRIERFLIEKGLGGK